MIHINNAVYNIVLDIRCQILLVRFLYRRDSLVDNDDDGNDNNNNNIRRRQQQIKKFQSD